MEILNQNKRNRAFWRIAILAVITWGAIIAVVYNTHREYRDQGQDELIRQQEDYETRIRELEGEVADKTVIINRLNKKVEDLQAAAASPDDVVRLCEERVKALEDEIERLDRRNQELERAKNSAEARLAAQNNF